jgi:hypothetical protein
MLVLCLTRRLKLLLRDISLKVPDNVVKNGAPEEIRTPDPQIRSLVLYPAELRALPAKPAANGQKRRAAKGRPVLAT